MPVKVPDSLPAVQVLQQEGVFVMTETRALSQDIRPLHIAILNLMPTKEITETQLLRVIGNTSLQVEVTFLQTASHTPHTTAPEHMQAFYKTFNQVRDQKFDGLIITGAPVEQYEFERVRYWQELTAIMDWAQAHVFSTLYICWAAQAGLFYRYGIPKYPLEKKCSGVFAHRVTMRAPLTRGFDDVFYAPHSRHTEVRVSDVEKVGDLDILALSDQVGLYLCASRDGKHVFVTGHSEYDAETLSLEYHRDIGKGMDVPVPANYFPDNDPKQAPLVRWRAHSNLLFANWLNYYVYQQTPFDIRTIG